MQHAFSSNLSLDLSYVGTHGDNLLGNVDLNQMDPVTGLRPYAAKFPYLQFINRTVNYAYSNYNSMQATLTKRVSHGLYSTGGYTFGHGLDNGSLNRFASQPQNSLNPKAEYAASDFDMDFSVFKTFVFKERLNAQFRAEFFNFFNHPNITNPFGSVNGYGGGSDPSSGPTFGCGCTTPDIAAGNPIVGSGAARQVQLGMKLTF